MSRELTLTFPATKWATFNPAIQRTLLENKISNLKPKTVKGVRYNRWIMDGLFISQIFDAMWCSGVKFDISVQETE